MTTDRELLEWAAKAAGIEFYTPEGMDEPWFALTYQSGFYLRGCKVWNPLVDDGDALRLAVKLGIVCSAGLHPKYVHDNDTMQAWASLDDRSSEIYASEEWSKQSGDPYAATRRAIVRAAASIGHQKNL